MKRRTFIRATMGAAAWTAVGKTALSEQDAPNRADTCAPLHSEVLVVGAGASGVPAALAAARCGARVLLVEEDAVPGGAPVDNYVAMLCGGPRVGIFREMVQRLNARFELSGTPLPDFVDGTDGCNHWYLPSAYVAVLKDMLAAETNLTFMGGARVAGVLKEADRVTGVLVVRGAGRPLQPILADVTIDATGTGAVAEWAGGPTQYGRNARSEYDEPFGRDVADDEVMPCTWMYVSQRLRPGPAPDVRRLRNRGMVEGNVNKWVGDGTPDFFERNTGVYLHWGATVRCADTRDPVALAAAQQEAYSQLAEDLDFWTEHGFAVHLAPRIGVRECRRVMGEHVLTVNDLKQGRIPADVVALSDYGFDPWGEQLTPEQIRCPRYGIGYRALIPRGLEGLLVAGKAISGTHMASTAYRVQPVVASIGTGAGVAAALAAGAGHAVRDVPIGAVQDRLTDWGVLV